MSHILVTNEGSMLDQKSKVPHLVRMEFLMITIMSTKQVSPGFGLPCFYFRCRYLKYHLSKEVIHSTRFLGFERLCVEEGILERALNWNFQNSMIDLQNSENVREILETPILVLDPCLKFVKSDILFYFIFYFRIGEIQSFSSNFQLETKQSRKGMLLLKKKLEQNSSSRGLEVISFGPNLLPGW